MYVLCFVTVTLVTAFDADFEENGKSRAAYAAVYECDARSELPHVIVSRIIKSDANACETVSRRQARLDKLERWCVVDTKRRTPLLFGIVVENR